jgi:hypothetical protein
MIKRRLEEKKKPWHSYARLILEKMAQVQNSRLFLSPISSKRYQKTHRVAARSPCSVLSSENIQELYDAFVLSQFVLETFSL